MSRIPKLDSRDSNDILDEVKNLANQYTSEWNFDANSSDFGAVFAKVFSNMMEDTISRYNKTSYNYYLTFLNMLGTKLRPASASEGMVTVEVMSNHKGAYIPKGSKISAVANTEEGNVIFETQDNLFAVGSKLKGVVFTDGKYDRIVNTYTSDESAEDSESAKMEPFRIFDVISYENLQKHELYFEDDMIFDMKKSNITFLFYNSISKNIEKKFADIFSDKENVTWQYYDGKAWQNIKNISKIEGGVTLVFDGPSKETEVMGKKSRYIRCVLNKMPEDDIDITDIRYKTKSVNLHLDFAAKNDEELEKKDFFPFGERYIVYDSFYFTSEEAFTKKGSDITIDIDMQFIKIESEIPEHMRARHYKSIMGPSDFAEMQPSDISIEEVVWEYWNGNGWSRLNVNENASKAFSLDGERMKQLKRTISFKCPENMSAIEVTSDEAHFIRARITKMKNRLDSFANYISPYIHNVDIKYEYSEEGHICREIMVKSNMNEYPLTVYQNGIVKLLKQELHDFPAMYLCLSQPLYEGTVRMFIEVESGINRYNPTLKWEYCADDNKGGYTWKHIDVMDLTDDFSHSETITMIGKNDFKSVKMFGHEGYFLRALNLDGKYHEDNEIKNRPVIRDIVFNSVKVVQRETLEPEYFSILPNEENKLCKLSLPNASNIEVWVNELDRMSTKEQELYLKLPLKGSRPEYDDLGILTKLWIKWEPIPNLVNAGVSDRVYEVDYSRGEILFGDGKNGKIPPVQQTDSICISYAVCNGSDGNIDAKKVTDFVKLIPNVQSVNNLKPIMGGIDKETIDRAASRIFGQVAGGNRLVSLSDYEDSIKYNDRNIYKVKCKSHVDENGKECMGLMSIAVLPRNYMQGYEKFQGIKNKIWQFIDEKSSLTLAKTSKVRIFEVEYVETCITIDVVIGDFNLYQEVHKGIRSKLEKFLNPISGNFSGRGWNIGEFPRKEFIYNYIKNVRNIKWIKNINIFTKIVTKSGKDEIEFDKVKEKPFVVPIFGEPDIRISID